MVMGLEAVDQVVLEADLVEALGEAVRGVVAVLVGALVALEVVLEAEEAREAGQGLARAEALELEVEVAPSLGSGSRRRPCLRAVSWEACRASQAVWVWQPAALAASLPKMMCAR